MHASNAAVYKLEYIFLYESMLCMHPMQPYIFIYIFVLTYNSFKYKHKANIH